MWHKQMFRAASGLTVIFPVLLLWEVPADMALSLIAVFFLAHCYVQKEWGWCREEWARCLGLLWLFMMARSAWAEHPLDALRRSAPFIRYVVFAAALARWTLADAVTRKRFFATLTGMVMLLAFDGLLQYGVGFDLLGHPFYRDPVGGHIRLVGLFPKQKTILGIMLAWLAFPALLHLMQMRLRMPVKILCFLAVFAAIALSGERMALLLALLGALLAGLLLHLRPRRMLAGFAGLFLLLGALFYASPAVFHRQFASTADTLAHWRESPYGMLLASDLTLAEREPLIGLGTGQFHSACETLYPGDKKRLAQMCNTHPHNIYLEWLIEEGVIGLALFIAFLVAVGRESLNALARERGNLIFIGLFIALALRLWPFMSSTGFFSRWGAPPFWLVLGALLVYIPPARLSAKK